MKLLTCSAILATYYSPTKLSKNEPKARTSEEPYFVVMDVGATSAGNHRSGLIQYFRGGTFHASKHGERASFTFEIGQKLLLSDLVGHILSYECKNKKKIEILSPMTGTPADIKAIQDFLHKELATTQDS